MSLPLLSTYENIKYIGFAIGIFLLFLLARKIFAKYIFTIILKVTRKVPSELFSQIVLAFEKPLQSLFVIIGLYVAATYFPYFDHRNTLFVQLLRSAMILLVSWGLFNLTSSSSTIFNNFKKRYDFAVDSMVVPFLSKILRFIIIAISIAIIADEFGFNVNGFVAGLGIGGLAISLAAKEALANLLGGVVIITEKPFTIGDWILTPSVEGTVEDISFRSTSIRTFAQAVVTVPNATLANEPITNWSKMGKRQVTFGLKVTPDTKKEKLEKVLKQINELLRTNEGVHPETIFVTFDEFKENGLNIYVYFFTKTTVLEEYLKIKEEINFGIMDILRNEGVAFVGQNSKEVAELAAGLSSKQEMRNSTDTD